VSGEHLVWCLESSEIPAGIDSRFRSMNRDRTVYVGGVSFRLVSFSVTELSFRGKMRMTSILIVSLVSFLQSWRILKMVRHFQRPIPSTQQHPLFRRCIHSSIIYLILYAPRIDHCVRLRARIICKFISGFLAGRIPLPFHYQGFGLR